jgi:lipid-A-disaccharide synthase-like uncharacterized protein
MISLARTKEVFMKDNNFLHRESWKFRGQKKCIMLSRRFLIQLFTQNMNEEKGRNFCLHS